jgi:hypothetical protein
MYPRDILKNSGAIKNFSMMKQNHQFLSNKFELTAEDIAQLNNYRWQQLFMINHLRF